MDTNTPIQPSNILLYNAQNIDETTLKSQFSIRQKEYKQIWQDIKTNAMDYPATHYLIQGVRGAGKTTLLTRLSYAVRDDEQLSSWLVPILFNEEEYGIFSLFTFWLRIAQKLALYDSSRYEALYAQLMQLSNEQENQAWALIRQTLIQHGQKIIVFIDNLAELFDGFSDNENAQLREILSLHPEIRIIGGSSVILDAHFDGTAPFYQFFKLVNLKAISESEMHELLRTLAQHTGDEAVERIEEIITQHPERIEAVRRLTDGVPRTIVLLFQIIMEGAKDSSFAYLEETIDKTTPLYKHRMDDLTRQQQVIVNAIAMNWDAMNVKEIAEQTRLPSKTISAQLAVLQKKWVIDKVETNTKNHLYLLKERFFNIWYLMRYGQRQDKRRVLWLTKFLEIWYSEKDLSIKLVEALLKLLDRDNTVQDLLVNALLASEKIDVDIRRVMKIEYDNRLKRPAVSLNTHQLQTKNAFLNIVTTADDNAIIDFIEYHAQEISLTDYLEYYHMLYQRDSKLFEPAKILSHVLTQSNAGLFEILHLYTAIYKRNLVGYKQVALQMIEVGLMQMPEDISPNILPLISIYWTLCIWDNRFESVAKVLQDSADDKLFNEEFLGISQSEIGLLKEVFFDDLIHMLLVKEQYEMAYQLFGQFDLKEILKPYYYAVLSYLKDERKEDYLRMGAELKGTVAEIIQSVAKFRQIYANNPIENEQEGNQ